MASEENGPKEVLDMGILAEVLRVSITRLARILRHQDPEALPTTLSSVLHSIRCEGPLTLGGLAVLEHLTPPTVTRVVGKLEARGLVERRRDDQDRRVSRVHVTPAGQRYFSADPSLRTAWLSRALRDLPLDDLVRLMAVVPVLIRLAHSSGEHHQ